MQSSIKNSLKKFVVNLKLQPFSRVGRKPAIRPRRIFLSALLATPLTFLRENQATAADTRFQSSDALRHDRQKSSGDYFSQDGYGNLNVIRVDLRTFTQAGNCSIEDSSGCTLDDVNKDTNSKDNFTVDIPVAFQSMDFTSDQESPNAILRQRGQSVRRAAQKSYRVKLDSKKHLWRKERRLQLNKHPYDASRIRNKLAFDLMQTIPHLPSLRTQFVNLWIDDGAGAVDFGLFTHVEHVGKEYVQNRGLDENDNIYKAEDFYFSADTLPYLEVDENGQPLNQHSFESKLEIKRGTHHEAVYRMVAAVSDYDLSFDEVLARFFDADNVLAWVTTNFLLLQKDSVRRNFYLHNPVNTEKFYFLPWDYDRSFEPDFIPANNFDTFHLIKRLSYGYARGAFNVFLDRYYRMDGVHDAIMAKADALRAGGLSEANINRLSDSLTTLVSPFTKKMPDAPISKAGETDSRVFSSLVGQAYHQLKWRSAIPLPPTLHEPVVDARTVTLSWRSAHDVTGSGPITYDLHVSSNADFDVSAPGYNVADLEDVGPINKSVIDRSLLPEGKLFIRLIARSSANPARDWQIASNLLRDEGKNYVGLVVFYNPA